MGEKNVKLNKINSALRKSFKPTAMTLVVGSLLGTLVAPVYVNAATRTQLSEDVKKNKTIETKKNAKSKKDGSDIKIKNKEGKIEIIHVTGMRGTMTRSLNEKKMNSAIVDVLAASDFGDLPGLSMSDVIENITSVTGHRGKGSASEMSIRGMGPFLGWATSNGRTVPSAGFSRSTNFKKYPKELSDKVVVYKSQQANLVEGGTSGTINIDSLRALDYGKQEGTLEIQGLYNHHDAKLTDRNGLGNKILFSWVDQLDPGSYGNFGYTLGFSKSSSSNPEDEMGSSSTMYACSMLDANGNRAASGQKRCYAGTGKVTRDNYADFAAADAAGEVFLGEKDYYYRTREDNDNRQNAVATFQWQPNDQWDINFDYAHSNNHYIDHRHDIGLAAALEYINTDPSTYMITNDRRLAVWEGQSKLQAKGEIRDELETYDGWGLNAQYSASNDLTITTDISHAKSYRNRIDYQTRIQTKDRVNYRMNIADSRLPQLTFIGDSAGINTNDPTIFSGGEARSTRKQDYRFSYMDAARVDINYQLENDVFSSIDAGFRLSKETLTDDKNTQWSHKSPTDSSETKEMKTKDTAYTNLLINQCFSASNNPNYMASENGNAITNSDGSHTWALMQADCAFPILQGTNGFVDIGRKAESRDAGDADVTEKIFAAYGMGNIDAKLFGIPVTGNLGVRYVKTEITSLGYRNNYTVNASDPQNIFLEVDTSTIKSFVIEDSSTNVLPSANIIFHLNDELLLRTSAYKAIAKPDQRNMGAGRNIITSTSNENKLSSLIQYVTGGNPYIKPLQSNNLDLSLEWYPSLDTAITGALYWKKFNANFRSIISRENLTIDGNTANVELRTAGYTNSPAYLRGIEVAGQKNFSFLPAPFNGLGVKASYNYVTSSFKNNDGAFGDAFDALGVQTSVGIPGVGPANLFGYSKNTFSGSVYWENDDFMFRILYKTRSRYYQPNTGAKANRYVEPFKYVDMNIKYKLNKMFTISLQAINVLDEPQYMTRANSTGTFISSSGPKYALSLKAKF